MNQVSQKDIDVFLPMPLFPIIEDVGWWQGEDGSAFQQPYRNAFPRCHCLEDYQALVRLADRLGVRIGLGMVLCEWDRNNMLRDITGATWMGSNWNNQINRGPWLDETAEYIRFNRDSLELGLHALCHEFWNDGKMERSEFHDEHGAMRSRQVIKSHLDAFRIIMEQNGFSDLPRLFFPPALNHSFGNGKESIQALLHKAGIRYVVTRFSRARCFANPYHEKMTWECGVGLMERGLSPVPWHVAASRPEWDFSGPILPLHWGNLLHPDPGQNNEIIDCWADMLLAGAASPHRILPENYDACWRQAAIFYFGKLTLDNKSIIVDLQALPKDLPQSEGHFYLKIRSVYPRPIYVRGAQILSDRIDGDNIRTLQLLPEERRKSIRLLC